MSRSCLSVLPHAPNIVRSSGQIKKIIVLTLMIFPMLAQSQSSENKSKQKTTMETKEAVYHVKQADSRMIIDANWDKKEWKDIETIQIKRHMGAMPKFVPVVESKMMYDKENLYVIFRVKDRFVKSTVTALNGPVSENSCVEFFFSPDTSKPLNYFNLEINAGGTPLIFHVTKPRATYDKLSDDDIKQIEIAHSLPAVVDPEIKEPVTWTIEYRIPVAMLKKYSNVTPPAPGIKWKGNFYKTGSETSNPNYMTWSFVDHPVPDFHLPQFFGTLVFN